MSPENLSIGDLARDAGCTVQISILSAKLPVCSLFDMPVNSDSAWTIFVNFYLSQTNQINLVNRLMP